MQALRRPSCFFFPLQNYRLKMRYSPDYSDVDQEQALLDFK